MFGFGRKINAPPGNKASAAGRVTAWGVSGRNVWSPRDGASLVRMGFMNNPVGFRAVKLIAEAAAALPLTVSGRDGRYADHPVLQRLLNPNPMQGGSDWFETLYGQLLLTGNAYVEAVGMEFDWPEELHVVRSDRMSVIPGDDGWPIAFEYAAGGRKHRWDVGDVSPICHLRSFHPIDDHYGLSPLSAAASAIDVHNAASRWSKGLLDNAARPSGAIVNEGEEFLSAEQFDRLSAELDANHQGAANAGRPMLLDGGLEWKPMGLSPSDMEFRATKEAAAREIATAFGIPPMMLGIPGEATYANYAEANRAFYRLTVLPLAGRVCERLATWLSQQGNEAIRVDIDRDKVPALQAERDAEWRRVSEAAFLSEAERRQLLGLPASTSA